MVYTLVLTNGSDMQAINGFDVKDELLNILTADDQGKSPWLAFTRATIQAHSTVLFHQRARLIVLET
ncbi:hypothetical protein OH492_19065 [Vibrio chagasii]|nr:hypothetical protein [Vibrio chagasii]